MDGPSRALRGPHRTGLDIPSWFTVTTVEGLTLLTLGLVRPWGEVTPRWIPLIGGKLLPIHLGVGLLGE
ncbi:hypothetical protein GCM10010505_77190 [Kitasatospora aburaviensis]